MSKESLPNASPPLAANAVLDQMVDIGGVGEEAWIEVIQKMDEVYAGLIQYEVELEEKNAALEEAQRFISSTLSSMSDMLIVCDGSGRIVEANEAAKRLTGYSMIELSNKTMADLVDERDKRALSCAEQFRDREIRLKTKQSESGETVALNCSPRIDHMGKTDGRVFLGRPVGELQQAYKALNQAHAQLKNAQRQLLQQEKMASLGRLVAGVAHELNNPISFIYGNVHVMQKYRARLESYITAIHENAAPAEIAKLRDSLRIDRMMADLPSLLDGVMEGSERVRDIVNSLRRLSFSPSTDPEDFDLGALVSQVLDWTAKSQKGRPSGTKGEPPKTTFEPPENLFATGHAGQIHQVLVNLVENAFDAANPERPRVWIKAYRDNEEAVVTVEDNGAGVPEEDWVRVFDPFFTTKPVGQGTGLGLWISYVIVQDHGGALTLGKGENGGALFRLTLPLSEKTRNT